MGNHFIRELPASRPSAVNLICFAHAGGGTSRYRTWHAELQEYANILIPVIPGREERFIEPAFSTLEQVADDVFARIKPYLDAPLVLAGISYGGLLAYEMATRLEQHGACVHALLVASQRAPHYHKTRQNWHQMPAEELIDCLVKLGGINAQDATTPEFYELFLSTIRADLEASDGYVPTGKAPLTCPIHVCHGLHDQMIDRQATRGWLDVTVNTVEWREFNAGHFLFDEQKDIWLQDVKNVLAKLSLHTPPTPQGNHAHV
ncbi:thioesterase II family protein [Xenorhabdus sp. PB30.3]|uniref:thioesterase II family protein n=1 Tax=Xenorhabdus sp. PB30.3 TaxID=2788941 RepID=UPI001E4FF126|nr:alpha/beta fold hydrolase [Xenorhabdus sp. PB30.3]MCC8380400.1 thioesterase [Xenorhabdus sp. PB30.3]